MAQQLVASRLLEMQMTVLRMLLLVAEALRLEEKRSGLRIRFIMAQEAWVRLLALLGSASAALTGTLLLRFTIRMMYLLVVLGTWFVSSSGWPTPLVALVLGLVGSRRTCRMVGRLASD